MITIYSTISDMVLSEFLNLKKMPGRPWLRKRYEGKTISFWCRFILQNSQLQNKYNSALKMFTNDRFDIEVASRPRNGAQDKSLIGQQD